ncbi:MAG: hypothetical protein ABIP33_06905 [Pseudolysinimonas sp.]
MPGGVGREGERHVHPSFDEFVAALRDPSLRASIGLSIGDDDAAALLTRHEWANDYYHQWLALFPAATAPAAAPPVAAAPPPAAAPASDFGPPPQLAPASQFSTPPNQFAPAASGMSSGLKRLLIIGGSVIGAVLLVVVGVSVYSGVVINAASHHPVTAGSSPSASASTPALPADLHGLSAREYPLLEAVFESEDRTIPDMVTQGMTEDRLRSLADTVVPQAERACTNTANLQGGFNNPTYKASFIAGYIATSKVTPDKAAKVYDAIVQYCVSG